MLIKTSIKANSASSYCQCPVIGSDGRGGEETNETKQNKKKNSLIEEFHYRIGTSIHNALPAKFPKQPNRCENLDCQ